MTGLLLQPLFQCHGHNDTIQRILTCYSDGTLCYPASSNRFAASKLPSIRFLPILATNPSVNFNLPTISNWYSQVASVPL